VDSPRLLILIVAYNADRTLETVLDRIPETVWQHGPRVLVIDDASQDETFEVGVRYTSGHSARDIEVLVNPVNQGYGGNQKLGYQYAIDHGFDAVALLHGDGQYAPEKLEELTAPVLSGEADAVLGTRMSSPRAALADGMPLYKMVGNRILTGIQNRLLGSSLSEFHSGYRVYSVEALRRIPFQINTDDYHFDTEILIQLFRVGMRVREIPSPVYYGDEIGRVKGLGYAWRVIQTTVASRIHDMGILFQRRYELRSEDQIYQLKLGYTSSHTVALASVEAGARVLDIGCGRGLLARELADRGCTVHGFDDIATGVSPALERFTRHNLDQGPPQLDLSDYDVVLLLDVIEHLAAPEDFLDAVRGLQGATRPSFMISVPNVAFAPLRARLLLGGFEYGREGVLDLTHRRLFTIRSLRRLLAQYGFDIHGLRGVPAPFPKAFGDNWFSRCLLAVNQMLIRLSRGLFSYQIFVVARARPTVGELLRRTRESSAERRRELSPEGAPSPG
jgi:2-polyprenyl-3-methyl-5-hydroxy-6-metoxy-1,4-benzoquinol methylase